MQTRQKRKKKKKEKSKQMKKRGKKKNKKWNNKQKWKKNQKSQWSKKLLLSHQLKRKRVRVKKKQGPLQSEMVEKQIAISGLKH